MRGCLLSLVDGLDCSPSQGPGEQPALLAEAAARLHVAALCLLLGRQPHLDGFP